MLNKTSFLDGRAAVHMRTFYVGCLGWEGCVQISGQCCAAVKEAHFSFLKCLLPFAFPAGVRRQICGGVPKIPARHEQAAMHVLQYESVRRVKLPAAGQAHVGVLPNRSEYLCHMVNAHQSVDPKIFAG